MIRLQTLGALELRAADGASVHQVVRQSKRLALLAYLAMERPGQFQRRDHLLGMFWPESDLRGGRGSLSQAIHFLRQHLGREVISTRGDEEVAVAADLLWCDATTFETLLIEGRHAEALALYGGPLLGGVFVEQAPGFEQWLEQKRADLQRAAMNAASALADAAELQGDYGDVVQWLRRAIGYHPYEESLHRRLIGALDASGDRVAALRAYDDLQRLLREEFEAEPAAETRELIDAVRARSEAQPQAARPLGRVVGAAVVSARRHKRRSLVAMVVGTLLLATAGVWGAVVLRRPVEEAQPLNRIAVLYFDDGSAAGDLGYLADGVTSTLIDHLGQVRQLEVISQNGVRPFRGDSLPIDSVARMLDVGTMVGGSITRSGDRLRVTVEMFRARTGVIARSRTFERPEGELFALLDDIAREVGGFLRASVGEELRFAQYRAETRSVPAWQAVQQAEQLLAQANADGERGQHASALALFEQVDSLLRHAALLDDGWPAPLIVQARAYEMRAWLALMTGRPDPKTVIEQAVNAADQAVERAARSAAALEMRGRLRYVQWLMTRPDSARAAELLRATEADLIAALRLEPGRARSESALSVLYESQGRFEPARQAARRALQADAYLVDADQIVLRLFQSSFEIGDDEDAGYWCDEVRRRMAASWPAAYCDLLLLGWRAQPDPDPRKALYILETFGAADRAELRSAMQPRLAMLAAASVARGGDTATAQRLLTEARASAPRDIELLHLEAATRALLGERDHARRLLQQYLTANPTVRPRIVNGRMFRLLHDQGQ